MRHRASLITAMEGMSRMAFRIARELAPNNRSGLTTRFLAKKLEIPEEEVEYLIDVNHHLFFLDLTKVKLVAEGASAVARVSVGLENHGDVPSLFNRVKALDSHGFRRLEEQVGLEGTRGKKAVTQELLQRCYRHPESVVDYVASRDFPESAQEVFDIVLQSEEGVMPVSLIRARYGGSEFEVEQALWKLFQGFALFEMFRFDSEDRLVRVAGILAELRQWREENENRREGSARLRVVRDEPDSRVNMKLDFSDRVCRLVAGVAARPARVRGDGDLYREDRRRLSGICPEEEEPSLDLCLWAAEGVGWLARVDDGIRAGELEDLIQVDRVERHAQLFEWLVAHGDGGPARRALAALLEEMQPRAWYSTVDFIRYAVRVTTESESATLKNAGGYWHYTSPAASNSFERGLARALEETFFWLGVVERGEANGECVFRVTDLGHALLSGAVSEKLAQAYPPRSAELIVQPNFDIVVPVQEVDALLTVPLEQFAERVSTGQVSVYRLTKDSFTKAIQEGHDGAAFVAFLLKHNRGGELPANVMTTLEDWRGGMKHVRLRTIHVLEVDDPLVMADLLHRRRFRKYFQPIDSSKAVIYLKTTKANLTKELEKEGFVVG